MPPKNILIIEDETKIARVIKLELEYEGYKADIAQTGKEGLKKYHQRPWDLILLDVLLPELNGLEVLRRIRLHNQSIPVLLLTARDSIPDKVSGLDQGANDYITKPFQIEELLARIRAHLRKNVTDERRSEDVLSINDLTVHLKTREVKRGDQNIELTPREYDLLVYLLRHPNQVLNREQILRHVWGFDYFGDTNVVDVYIRYLRKKVDQGFAYPLIHTVRGVGYCLREHTT